MYAPHFGLRQEAFSIAPDPRFLFLSAMHREALAHLLYGLQGGGGFVLLTGEIGAGKTTVCRCFLEQIPPGHHVAYVFNPKLTVLELLQTVCQEFGITVPAAAQGSVKQLVDALNRFMLHAHAAGHNCLLVIDEAQSLSPELLEQLRLLTNLETSERKLLQIVLIGQPELRAMLARPDLEQLAQRVIARVHLGALGDVETADYVRHRLAVAGHGGALPFDARALSLVHRLSGGVPRRINLLCQRALLGAYSLGTTRVSRAIVHQAAREVFEGAEAAAPRRRAARSVAGLAVLAGLGGLGVLLALLWWQWPRASRLAAVLAPGASAPASAASGSIAGPGPAVAAAASLPATTAAAVAAAQPASAAASAPSPELASARYDENGAWQALGVAWGLALPATAACDALRGEGLECHHGQGDLALLRRLDRPLLLQLQPQGWVMLNGLGERTALVQSPAGQQRLPVDTLAAAWGGRYATLWRPPPGWPAGATAATGGAADWTLQRLVTLQGEARGAAVGGREGQLRQRVFAFQVAQGLALDGVAGPITLMQLNRASGVSEPQLRKEP